MRAETYSVKFKIISEHENPDDDEVMEWYFIIAINDSRLNFDVEWFRDKIEKEKSKRSKSRPVAGDSARGSSEIFIGGAIAKGENTRSINKSKT